MSRHPMHSVAFWEEPVSWAQVDITQVDTPFGDSAWTPMRLAVENSSLDTIKRLAGLGVDIHQVNRYGETLLFIAPKQVEVFKYLIDCEVEIDWRDNWGNTALHIHANDGNIDLVRILLEHGADVNARNGFGATPLHSALRGGDNENIDLVVIELLRHGVDVNAVGRETDSPLVYALRNPVVGDEIVDLLMLRGARVELRHNYRRPIDTNWQVENTG